MAISAARDTLIAGFAKANLIAGSVEPLALNTDSSTVRICLQLGTQSLLNGVGLTAVSVPERPSAFILCDPSALAACRTQLVARLGNGWKGLLYVVPVFQWVKDGSRVGPPSRKLLAQTAAALDTSAEPDPASTLQQTDLLLVAPAPDGVTEDDLRQKLGLPPSK
jgi:hypothetical protein